MSLFRLTYVTGIGVLRAGLVWVLITCGIAAATTPDWSDTVDSFIHDHCLDCHADGNAEANINLEQMLESPSLATQFKTWEKVLQMVRTQQMPPRDATQPTKSARTQFSAGFVRALDRVARDEAGAPGQIVLRRLTSAEYAYTIQELTGLQLDIQAILTDDAVGGEGFTNVGEVQFVQESTMERYLEAAKLVADHAIIGTGPLRFAPDPGMTGMELSAIHRVQAIYREYGFRTAAGEGGEPFGLQRYPDALFVAWQYKHRDALGIEDATLLSLSREQGLKGRLAEHVWNVLQSPQPSFPISEIVRHWDDLPAPSSKSDHSHVKRQCDSIASRLRSWQRRLARTAGDDEEAALLSAGTFQFKSIHEFRANIDWETGQNQASVDFEVQSLHGGDLESASIVWRKPMIQFRREDRSNAPSVPLASRALDAERFGKPNQRLNDIGDHDLVARTGNTTVRFMIPPGSRSARLRVTAELVADTNNSATARVTIRDGSDVGDTAADTGEISAVLGIVTPREADQWARQISEFARLLPDTSQGEPAPSDRDPIPPPFDGGYNTPERNDFHYTIKYHRDDAFLVDRILDDQAKRRLDQAWHDLLSSFDYHQRYLRFVAQKSNLDLEGQTIATLERDWSNRLPAASKVVVDGLLENHDEIQAALKAAQPSHVSDVIRFARLAWRRPLESDEAQRLHDFYGELRSSEGLDHIQATRALLTRVLVSPAFLYRLNVPATSLATRPLTNWELANRLSYFLWSSPPDPALREAAKRGSLNNQTELERQVTRMLTDAKAKRFAKEFFGQWFGFYQFDRYRGIDAGQFPQFDAELRQAMLDEAITTFDYIVRENRPVSDVLFAPYAFVNQRLATHYGFPPKITSGLSTELERIDDVARFHRGGLLGFGAIHAITSAPLRTSAVKRGDWILRRILGTPVPPPPADAGSIPAEEVLADGMTVRQRLAAHRQKEACIHCHSRIDALGFALERFDPIGQWRETYRDGQLIDTSGTLHDGTTLDGPDGLSAYLHRRRSDFFRTLSSKLLGYALGRRELLSDRSLIDQMVEDLDQGRGMKDVAQRIVTSSQFRMQQGSKVLARADRERTGSHVP